MDRAVDDAQALAKHRGILYALMLLAAVGRCDALLVSDYGSGLVALTEGNGTHTIQLSPDRRYLIDTYSRVDLPPVHNLRPARETCEQCHWPEKFHGDKVKVVKEYADDKEVTETVSTLRIHVGGGSEKTGIATGIHWHMNIANEIDYIATDDKRQTIGYVRLKDRQGNVREYFADGVTEEQLRNGERRRMDCMDCHNRPAHVYLPPDAALDQAFAAGIGANRRRQHARDRRQRAIEAEFAQHREAGERIGRQRKR